MAYLLTLSLGPVQDFIAASRRTADLQAGSSLLVEMARAAAFAVVQQGGTLIFPSDPRSDGPNKILAEVPDNPEMFAEAAEAAARDCLDKQWVASRSRIPSACLLDNEAADQLARFLEFYSAWEPLNQNYPEARRRVDRRLAGRKALRDFQQPASRAGQPKSPLDPSRDCVLHLTSCRAVPEACRKDPLRLKKRETLDAVSLLKRLKGYADSAATGTPSTTQMAVRAFTPEIERKCPNEWHDLERIVRAAPGMDTGDAFFESRVEEVLEGRPDASVLAERIAPLRRTILKALAREEMPAYYAILVADGDHMGRAVGDLDSPDKHRGLSSHLSGFAAEAGRIVHTHRGHLIYSGGDDVLAFLPVTEALACARNLADAFRQSLGGLGLTEPPTLSVGVAFVHHMDPLSVSLDHARDAERAAKVERSSMAVALHTRGGSPVTVALRWPAAEWPEWIHAFARGLSRGLAYELRQLALDFRDCAVPAERVEGVVRGEARRVMNRKEGKSETDAPEMPEWVRDAESLERFAHLLVMARFLFNYEETP